ncbi:MAG: hypothetical protein FIA92_17140 [Chloroflexi bacterium]|nr:hypothetical protein [Chloroflexota bacterium]
MATTLWSIGAEVPVPELIEYDGEELAFAFGALLPGPQSPRAPEIWLGERWTAVEQDDYRLTSYVYEFIERALDRRQAFHRHDEDWFLDRYAVTVHQHCEEVIGEPVCSHYFGLPIDPFEAVHRFFVQWGQPGPLGCAELRCMS